MTTQYPQTSCCGRCFTYPQGAVSFLPQVFATVALWGCIASFSTWQPLETNWIYHAPNFLCLLIKSRVTGGGRLLGDYYSYEPTPPPVDDGWHYRSECLLLTFHDQTYWDIVKDDTKWAWAIRLACLFAILTTILGGIATIILWSATCFSLRSRILSKVSIILFCCVPLSLMTLIAAATDLCQAMYGPKDDYPENFECQRNKTGIRLSYGATTMIFVSIFYLLAGFATRSYRWAVLNGDNGEYFPDDHTRSVGSSDIENNNNNKHHEVIPLVHHHQQQQQPVVRTTIKHTPEGIVTTKETTNPDGSVIVQIIEDESRTTASPNASPSGKKKRKVKKSPKKSSVTARNVKIGNISDEEDWGAPPLGHNHEDY